MIVATKRVGSNILFSCFIGPMRKTVLRGKHTEAIQSSPGPARPRPSPPPPLRPAGSSHGDHGSNGRGQRGSA